MSYTIAIAGKGGTGKTTISGLMVRYLVQKKMTPVLAVDADSNSNLNEVLGIQLDTTLGDAREDMKKGAVPNMTKDIFMEMKVNQALVEDTGYDLIAMGRPEGEGCYCAANNLLSACIEKLESNYKYIVIDNEAGMEHVSRLITKNIDLMIIVSDPSRRGLQAAHRIDLLAGELNLIVKKKFLIVNQAKEDTLETIQEVLNNNSIPLAGFVPEEKRIYEYDMKGLPTAKLSEDTPAVKAAFSIFDTVIGKS